MALTLIPETLFPVLPAGGDGTTRPLHQGECVRRAWPQVLGDGDRPGVVSPGALCPPAGAGAPAAPGQRTRRRGRREQGTGRRDTPARGPGRWGPPGRPAVAHVRRGHAASSPAPASRGGNGALAASPAPPERPGPASAATAPCRRPHLPAHVQQRVIVFIVQLLLAQGRRHLRNLSPRQTGRPRSGGTGGRRRHSGPWRSGGASPPPAPESSAPAPCAPARPRAGAAPGPLHVLPAHPSPAGPRQVCAGTGQARLGGRRRWWAPSARRGDRPLRHLPARLAGPQGAAHPLAGPSLHWRPPHGICSAPIALAPTEPRSEGGPPHFHFL